MIFLRLRVTHYSGVNAKSYFFSLVCAVSESSSLTPQAGLCKVPASPIINGLKEMQVWRSGTGQTVRNFRQGLLGLTSTPGTLH